MHLIGYFATSLNFSFWDWFSEEWEKEVKAKVETAAKTTQSFREIES
jgi:hypothetical protein